MVKPSSILVFGHICPDTDSVVSALAATALLRGRGMDAEACMTGPLNTESAFVLRRFGLPCPRRIDSVSGRRVALVDFSNSLQGLPDLKDAAEVVAIFDHHRCDETLAPRTAELWVAPTVCCATLLHQLFRFYEVPLSPALAGGMLCAILSDSSLFKASAVTPQDKKAARELAMLAGVNDMETLGRDLLEAKADFSGCTMRDLLLRDYKDFFMNGQGLGIGQLEVPDLEPLQARQEELLQTCAEVAAERKHHIMLAVTDLNREGSLILVASPRLDIFEKAFGQTLTSDAERTRGRAWIQGMISRKTDMVQPLRKAFAEAGLLRR